MMTAIACGAVIGVAAEAVRADAASSADSANAAVEQAATATGSELQEILVTARRREETILSAPVIVQAVTKQEIQNLHIESIQDIATAIPNLEITYSFAIAGITVNLRGIGNGSSALFADQDTALNLDGFTSNSGILYRQGLFDLGQIEVLKGPQSLYFGKSTSAGLIAIHSADPTTDWESSVTSGYEFNANQVVLNGYVSGPITDHLGIRVAGYRNTMEGYLYNPNPFNPVHRLPGESNTGARLTLKYDNPDVGLVVKFKAAYTHDGLNIAEGDLNQTKCHSPGVGNVLIPPYNLYDDCVINKYTSGDPTFTPYNPHGSFAPGSPAWATGNPIPQFENGQSYGSTNTGLGVLDIDYDLPENLTLSSVTGDDYIEAQDVGPDPTATGLLGLAAKTLTQEFSQELRLTSNWKDSWVNFMVGALYSTAVQRTGIAIPIPAFTIYFDNYVRLNSKNDSGFVQVLLTPFKQWELSAGARYQSEHREFGSMIARNNFAYPIIGPGEGVQNTPLSQRSVTEHATTPEVTLSYKPWDDLTAFVSYKKGYKGPAFNVSLTAPVYNENAGTSPVAGEHVNGYEGGVKAQLFDHRLALTATGYRYNYDDLQVAFTNITKNTTILSNGANARVQGIELGADYSPIQALTLNAFLNYNDAHFTAFPAAPCYGDQPAAAGCIYTPTGAAYQDLAGRTLNFAPKVTGSLGANYTWSFTDKYAAQFNIRGTYQSSEYTTPELNRLGIQPSFGLLNLGVRVGPHDGTWEVGLLCTDCTNRVYVTNGLDAGAGSAPPGLGAVVFQNVARPLQVLLQLTVRPNKLF
jgi:iron complex outermembrane receptor protein